MSEIFRMTLEGPSTHRYSTEHIEETGEHLVVEMAGLLGHFGTTDSRNVRSITKCP